MPDCRESAPGLEHDKLAKSRSPAGIFHMVCPELRSPREAVRVTGDVTVSSDVVAWARSFAEVTVSGRQDLNLRPLDPQDVGLGVTARHARYASRLRVHSTRSVRVRARRVVPEWSPGRAGRRRQPDSRDTGRLTQNRCALGCRSMCGNLTSQVIGALLRYRSTV